MHARTHVKHISNNVKKWDKIISLINIFYIYKAYLSHIKTHIYSEYNLSNERD